MFFTLVGGVLVVVELSHGFDNSDPIVLMKPIQKEKEKNKMF